MGASLLALAKSIYYFVVNQIKLIIKLIIMSFAPKFPPFVAACSDASRTFNEKSFTQRVFLAKNV